jgi:hypothetical protein
MRGAFLVGVLLLLSVSIGAQEPPQAPAPASGALVQLGSLRVPPCPEATDPQYGFVREKAIKVGGGAGYGPARERVYLTSLRGPQGQPVRISNSRGSGMLPGEPEIVIIDSIGVTYDGPDGPVARTLFLNEYQFELPKVPTGFTCGTPIVTALGMPPVDPIKANPELAALAIEQGTKAAVTAIKLDASVERGFIFDRHMLIAARARAAAEAGTPLEPTKPPRDLPPLGWTVVAYPLPCGDRQLLPQNVVLSGPQGTPIPLIANDAVLRGTDIARLLPGVPAPAGSMALRFPQAQFSQATIAYAEACDGQPAQVTLPFRPEPPVLERAPYGVAPADADPAELVMYLQIVLDAEGRFSRPLYIGGPRALMPAALDALSQWRARPVRVNGVPIVNPMVVQVPLRR